MSTDNIRLNLHTHTWAVYAPNKNGTLRFTGRFFTNAPCAAQSVLCQKWGGGFIYHPTYGAFYGLECQSIHKIPTQSWNENKAIADNDRYAEWLYQQSMHVPRPLPDNVMAAA